MFTFLIHYVFDLPTMLMWYKLAQRPYIKSSVVSFNSRVHVSYVNTSRGVWANILSLRWTSRTIVSNTRSMGYAYNHAFFITMKYMSLTRKINRRPLGQQIWIFHGLCLWIWKKYLIHPQNSKSKLHPWLCRGPGNCKILVHYSFQTDLFFTHDCHVTLL